MQNSTKQLRKKIVNRLSPYRTLPIFLIIMVSTTAFALNTQNSGFYVDSGETKTIDVHSNCKRVANSSSSKYFIPTKLQIDWDAFLANPPTGVTLDTCKYRKCQRNGAAPYTGCETGWPQPPLSEELGKTYCLANGACGAWNTCWTMTYNTDGVGCTCRWSASHFSVGGTCIR